MRTDSEKIQAGDEVHLHDVEIRLAPGGLTFTHKRTRIQVVVPVGRSAQPAVPHGLAAMVAGFCQHLDAALQVRP